jgi:hypothetical protein
MRTVVPQNRWSRFGARGSGLAAALALALAACGDSTSSGGGGTAGGSGGGGGALGGAFDGGQGGLPSILDANSGRPPRDFGTGDGGLAGFREACNDNLDCASRWCVPFEDHNVCTQTCLDEGCPDGWNCHAVANTNPDVVFICFPPGNRLCGGCVQDADCPGGRCYGLDGLNVCGLDCETDETCPQSYACQKVFEAADAPKQCVPRTQSCTCDEEAAGNVRVCEKASETGTCYGRETCDAERGWTGCDAPEPRPEVCNLADDDCNGLTDDIAGLGGECERTVEIDGAESTCRGRLVCSRESEEPVCTAAEPVAEACNYLDDDCDGDTDETFPERGAICEIGVGVCRRVGVTECTDDGTGTRCNVVEGAPEPERCDGLDNDCDGETDEGFEGLNEPCFNGVGACRRAGALRCSADGAGVECPAVPGEPSEEVCDGVDNNCDGTDDEGFDGLFEPCEAGLGGCRRQGFLYCTEDGRRVECTAIPTDPAPERCNGIDDDCNGQVDELYPDLNTPCSRGLGLCQRAGVNVCAADGMGTLCNAPDSEPQGERCDGLDNDCDGEIDEDFAGLDEICQAGEGACQRVGIVVCTPDGLAAACSAVAAAPQPEVCNGLDDDCNGAIDEPFLDVARPCSAGEGACLRFGVYRCAADGAATVCDAAAGEPADEACNSVDDDCDGETDEDFDQLDTPCNSGLGACARAGIYVCGDDGLDVVCNAEAGAPEAESCNGLDDDCNGRTDEAFADLGRRCEVGRGECRQVGLRICAADGAGTTCSAEEGEPQAETCDSRDNDCDGSVDEGFAGLNTACQTGVGECARPGVRVCSADGAGVACNAIAGEPAAELCDGRDNDCNGRIDDGFAGIGEVCDVGRGVCARTGVQVCAADGAGVVCNVAPGQPQAEVCNNADDDCDGTVDEGYANLGRACVVGRGICNRAGVLVCNADGDDVECDAEPGPALAAELCNGLDDTCDGRIDEGIAGLGEICTDGRGACLRTGVNVCDPAGNGVVCNVQAGQPGAETCNGIDDNCDGRTDEGFAGLGQACVDGRGICQRAGVNVCAAGGDAVVCNAVPGQPAAGGERCNGLDDDCNGQVDETFPDLNTACQAGDGACMRAGVRRCSANGAGTECNAVPGQPVAELCDGIDNDCDRSVDDGFAGLGQACVSGQGICRRNGVLICDANNRQGAPVCDAVAGAANPAETCDNQDDDCDGAIDDGFRNANGIYNGLTHCGYCGNDCNALWNNDPEAFGVAPRCDVAANRAQCAFSCLPGRLDADGVANNGCELVIDAGCVYVSTPANQGVDNAGCGTVQAPCATITYGIGRAVAQGRTRVRVSDGVYRESVTLTNGISVLGGHHRTTWIQDPALNVTIINGRTLAGIHRKAVIATGITLATVFEGFVVNGESPLQEGNSYGIYVRDSNNALTIRNNRIFAGDGGRGVPGTNGSAGQLGVNGGVGRASYGVGACASGANVVISAGGTGGARTCGAVVVNGGNGGGTVCPDKERPEGDGVIGGNGLVAPATNAGPGGDGAWGMQGVTEFFAGFPISRTCNVSDNGAAHQDAYVGSPGNSGTDATGGAGAANNNGSVGGDNEWRGALGTAGGSSRPGGGGGGGGGAAGVRDTTAVWWDVGATGGGGGSGGCQGTSGTAGSTGGASFGIFVTFTGAGPNNAAGNPVLTNNEVTRGLGGNGGNGGNGGPGGDGGDGANGGAGGQGDLNYDFCSYQGGKGGKGGRGGHGGGGGGGNGGISYDIYVQNDNNSSPDYAAANSFGIPAGTATGGARGEGGGSLNVVNGLGAAGNAGASGNVLKVP